MKTFGILFVGLVLFVGGYLLGSYWPMTGFIPSGESIKGSETLQVTVLRPDQTPVVNLEVDIATEPGPPSEGGVAKTDSTGKATFNINPGTYYVFFNTNNFPAGLQVPKEEQIEVTAGQINTKTIILQAQ